MMRRKVHFLNIREKKRLRCEKNKENKSFQLKWLIEHTLEEKSANSVIFSILFFHHSFLFLELQDFLMAVYFLLEKCVYWEFLISFKDNLLIHAV
jgi:hypothetical protein